MATQAKKIRRGPSREVLLFLAAQRSAGLQITEEMFKGLDVRHAVAILLSEEERFRCHKRVIFAGFLAWLITSENLKGSKSAIAYESARLIAKVEAHQLQGKAQGKKIMISLENSKYGDLYKQIYCRIGGLQAMADAIKTSSLVAKNKERAKKEIPYIVGLAQIWDFHVRELVDAKYGQPNIEDAAPLAHHFADASGVYGERNPTCKKLSSSQIRQEHYPRHLRSISFLFGAAHTWVEGRPLLQLLLSGKLTFEIAAPVLGEWFSYASYFEKSVLPRRKKNGPKTKTNKAGKLVKIKQYISRLATIDPVQPPLPAITPALQELIRQAFQQAPV